MRAIPILLVLSLAAACNRPPASPQSPAADSRVQSPPIEAPAPRVAAPAAPGQGSPCPDGACAPGLECVAYYGIAGPSGPRFTSCEIRCVRGRTRCPAGQTCVTIADGPGSVCRVAEGAAPSTPPTDDAYAR